MVLNMITTKILYIVKGGETILHIQDNRNNFPT